MMICSNQKGATYEKVNKKIISSESVVTFEAKHSCPCYCANCDCTICSPNDETWMFNVLYTDEDNYGSSGVIELFDSLW